jgi:hypothetical protein
VQNEGAALGASQACQSGSAAQEAVDEAEFFRRRRPVVDESTKTRR